MVEKDEVPIRNIIEYLKRVSEISHEIGGNLAFRGLGDDKHPICSTAARRLYVSDSEPESMRIFKEYNDTLISNAQLRGYHRKGSVELDKLEILAELQHYGAATGLIDFTRSSLIALYFAVSNMKDEFPIVNPEDCDEKLSYGVVYIVNTEDSDIFKDIDNTNLKKDFSTLLDESIDSDKLWIWIPSDLNNRIPIQHSLFIFGKPTIDKKYTRSIKIHPGVKKLILSDLSNFHNINEESLFNDLVGFAKSNNIEKTYLDRESKNLLDKVLCEASENWDPKESLKLIDQAYNSMKNPVILRYRAYVNTIAGNYEDAERDYSMLIEKNSEGTDFYFIRMGLRRELKDYEGMIEDCKIILDFYPGNKDALNMLEFAEDKLSKKDLDNERS